MSWQPVTGQSANPFTIVREDGQYTASRGEHVFSDGGEITLPAPEEDSLIVITSLNGNPVDIVGTVDGVENPTHALDQQKPVYLMSDGQTWFHASKQDVLRIISMVHIETQVANDDETIDFTEVFSDEYDRYILYVDNLQFSDRSRLMARLSSDGGDTWDSNTGDYAFASFTVDDDGGTGTVGSDSEDDDGVRLQTTNNTGSEDDEGGGFTVFISNPIDGSRSTALRVSSSASPSADGRFVTDMSGGLRLAQTSVDSIRLFGHSDNNITKGIFSVYGVKS